MLASGATDLVIDIGSNVGVLLQMFKDRCGMRVLGVDPATNIAAVANRNGVETLPAFFDEALWRIISSQNTDTPASYRERMSSLT